MNKMKNNKTNKKCCELCRPSTLEKKAGLDTCRHSFCGCHTLQSEVPTCCGNCGLEERLKALAELKQPKKLRILQKLRNFLST